MEKLGFGVVGFACTTCNGMSGALDPKIQEEGIVKEWTQEGDLIPDGGILIDGAGKAASAIDATNEKTALGLIVSCVGRKIVMDYLPTQLTIRPKAVFS